MRLPLSLLVLLTLGCEKNEPSAASASTGKLLTTVPPALAPKVAAAKHAAQELGKTLSTRLTEAMAADGPEGAIDVCALEAAALTQSVAKKHNAELGRTSHKLRNPKNAPRPWVQPWLDAHAGKKSEAARVAVYDLKRRLGVVIPIATAPLCTTCHGQDVAPPLLAEIRSKYPADRATGFNTGDLRGAFWVEMNK